MSARRPSRGTSPAQGIEEIDGLDELADALLSLRTKVEYRRFLRDLCTIAELEALAHRWRIVMLLDQDLPYLEVAQLVPTSTATVTRVAHWLHHGTGGYRTALDRIRRPRGAKNVR
jgi:TrpR-related protein YerC/YecD